MKKTILNIYNFLLGIISPFCFLYIHLFMFNLPLGWNNQDMKPFFVTISFIMILIYLLITIIPNLKTFKTNKKLFIKNIILFLIGLLIGSTIFYFLINNNS